MDLIPEPLLKMVNSRKHSFALIFLALVLGRAQLGVPDSMIWPLAVVFGAAILGQGLADFGKEKSK